MVDDQNNAQEPDVFSCINWAEAWRVAHQNRRHHDDPQYWDERALAFCGGRGDSTYIMRFIELMNLRPKESVLDVGCGNGALALRLAEAGHPVTAIDFSSKMLERLEADAQSRGLTNINIVQASWEDDWTAAGIEATDHAVASRSLGVRDLAHALRKLSKIAKKRVGVSIPTSHSPRYSKELWEAVGRKAPSFRDHIYCMNILFEEGITPELQLIPSIKHDQYASFEEACKRAASALGSMTTEERARFDRFCKDHIVQRKDNSGQTYWTRDYQRKTTWAFISWNIND